MQEEIFDHCVWPIVEGVDTYSSQNNQNWKSIRHFLPINILWLLSFASSNNYWSCNLLSKNQPLCWTDIIWDIGECWILDQNRFRPFNILHFILLNDIGGTAWEMSTSPKETSSLEAILSKPFVFKWFRRRTKDLMFIHSQWKRK